MTESGQIDPAADLNRSRADLARLSAETPFVQAEISLAQVRVEEARALYQRGELALPELVEVESVLSCALADLEAHRSALVDLEQRSTRQEKAESIAALTLALERNRAARLECMTEALTRLEAAELALHNARLYVRDSRRREAALIDAGKQQLARLAALEGRPSPAVARLETLEERRDFETLLDFWQLADGDRLARMDADGLVTVVEPEQVRSIHFARWEPVGAQVIRLNRR